MDSVKILLKRFIFGLSFIVLSLFFSTNSLYAQEFKPDELIVKMRPSYSSDERLKFHHEIGAQVESEIKNLGVDILRISSTDIKRLSDRLKNDPRVLYAEPNFKTTAYDMTNDPALVGNLQWGLLKINAAGPSDSAWTISHGNSSVLVAVLDSGIDQSHEDLKGKVTVSHNCTNTSSTNDIYGHGTHVAGIIAANTNNNLGVAGLGYNISLINAKGLDNSGSGYYSWLADCLVWASDNGAKVINMSLGGSSNSQLLSDAIDYAWNKGVVLVASAGNSASSSPSYPAYYAHVISVAATDQNDNIASFSNYGKWVDVAAPGVNIYSTLPNSPNAFKQKGYGYGSGTSMSSPFVAGLAGLLFSMGGLDNNAVVKLIQDNADKIPGTGSDWIYGRINAYQSLLASIGAGNSLPDVSPIPSNTPTPVVTSTPISTSTPIPTSIPTPTPTTSSIPIPPKAPSPPPPPKSPFLKLCNRIPSMCR